MMLHLVEVATGGHSSPLDLVWEKILKSRFALFCLPLIPLCLGYSLGMEFTRKHKPKHKT